MYPWSSNFSLRMEVDALKHDLAKHYINICNGRCHNEQELLHWKRVRLEALEAFAHAQFTLSQIDPRHNYISAATARHRYGPTRHPYKRNQPKKQTSNVKAVTTKSGADPVEKTANKDGHQETVLNIKVEPGLDHNGNTEGRKEHKNTRKLLPLIEIKIENIKQERED